MYAISVGKQTHTLTRLVLREKGPTPIQTYVANSIEGVDEISKAISQNGDEPKVAFVGNWRWAAPIAFALENRSINTFYYRIKQERGARGRIGNVSKLAVKLLSSGVAPSPFFRQRQPEDKAQPELPTIYQMADEYLAEANFVREFKHRILNCLAITFPEVVKAGTTFKVVQGNMIPLPVPSPQPPDLFTKKMRIVLEHPDPDWLAIIENKVPSEVKELAKKSLARFVPSEIRQEALANCSGYLKEYEAHLVLKEEKMAVLREALKDHSLVKLFGGGDFATVVAAYLGWRQWPNFRELRRFCGLDVSRIDSKGKPRISRVRPNIRQYLFLLGIMTKKGRKITGGTKKRVKKIERLLKYCWNACLKGQEMQELKK